MASRLGSSLCGAVCLLLTSALFFAAVKEDGALERYARHGWGDVSLLKPSSTRPTAFDKPPKQR